MLSSVYMHALQEVSAHGAVEGIPVYLVGGVVRDLARGIRPSDRDIDVMVVGDGIGFARSLAARVDGSVRDFPRFLTAKITAPRGMPGIEELDVASAREETYERPGALPTVVRGTLERDLWRRDFSVNAMAIPIGDLLASDALSEGSSLSRDLVYDPTGGWDDLQHRTIRVLHHRSFIDDPTRLFRAARYAARIGGALEPETHSLGVQAIKDGCLETISLVRIFHELMKVSMEEESPVAVRVLTSLGVWSGRGMLFQGEGEKIARAHEVLRAHVAKEGAGSASRVIAAYWLSLVADSEQNRALLSLQYSKPVREEIKRILDCVLSEKPTDTSPHEALLVGIMRESDQWRNEDAVRRGKVR